MLIKTFMRFQKPAGDDGSDTGGSVDRGDNLPDIDPEDPDAELAAAEAEAKLRKELADKEKGESEDEDEDEDGDEPKAKKKDSRIPLSRHKEILEKERAARAELEQRLAQYQHGGEVANINENITAIENEVLKMEREYTKELADGELDKAAAIMSKIRQAERQITEAKGDMKIQAAEARATERARYNIALERIESAFPVLNPDHDSFDAETMQDVVELKDAYQMKGLTPTAALQR